MKKGNYKVSIILVLISGSLALASFELVLRTFFPKYQYAAEANYQLDELRIWSRRPNIRTSRVHPDNGRLHKVHYNNLALRQNRDIFEQDLSERKVVSIFGDSFTENLRMPSQYGFVDVLDYLLNDKLGPHEVLNFGVAGYGTGQEYMYYLSSDIAKTAEDVFYVFVNNDIRNIYENSLFALGKNGELRARPARDPSILVRTLSKLHVTYLLFDVRNRFRELFFNVDKSGKFLDAKLIAEHAAGEGQRSRFHDATAEEIESKFLQHRYEEIDGHMNVFYAILKQWSDDVEAEGGKFHIVLTPTYDGHIGSNLVQRGFSVIDLKDLFVRHIKNYSLPAIRFVNDGHWNELGNMYAAMFLFNFIRGEEKLGPLKTLVPYYSAFPNGWFPSIWEPESRRDGPMSVDIRKRYSVSE